MDDAIMNSIQTDVKACDIHSVENKKPRLTFEEEMKSYTEDGLGYQPVLRKKDVIHLNDDLSREQIKELYEHYKRVPGDKKKTHPYIAETLKISTCEDMSEFWSMVAEAIPEDPDYKEISQHWIEAVNRKNDRFDELENKIRDLNDPDLITLAGITSDEAEDVIAPPAQDEVKNEITSCKRYPKNFEVDFSGDYITINKVPTNIATVFVKNSYIGLTGLLSHEKAIQIITKILKKKIDPLFEVA